MKNKIDIQKIKDKKLLIATPMFGSQCYGNYTASMLSLAHFFATNNISLDYYYLGNSSLVTRARNICVRHFLESDADSMIFIDADIGFSPESVLQLFYLQQEEGFDVIGGAYPKKGINWDKVANASNAGVGKNNPFELKEYSKDYVYNFSKEEVKNGNVLQPLIVQEIGTGFLMINRKVFTDYRKSFSELSAKEYEDSNKELFTFFDTTIDKETREYLSEDYMFCRNLRKINYKIWLCPWVKLNHMGSYSF